MQIILWALLIYILYRFIVGFVLPIARTARQVKRQFSEMQQQASSFQSAQQQEFPHSEASFTDTPKMERTTSGKKGSKEDYIDFEELPKK